MDTYTKVENGLYFRLNYLEALKNHQLRYSEYLWFFDQGIMAGDHGGNDKGWYTRNIRKVQIYFSQSNNESGKEQ